MVLVLVMLVVAERVLVLVIVIAVVLIHHHHDDNALHPPSEIIPTSHEHHDLPPPPIIITQPIYNVYDLFMGYDAVVITTIYSNLVNGVRRTRRRKKNFQQVIGIPIRMLGRS